MTEAEARAKAEKYVYCDLTLGCIIYDCEKFGIPTCDSKGRTRNRSELESDLIEAMVNAWRIATGVTKEREDGGIGK